MTSPAPARRLVLCADDYGMSPGVSRGIRELVAAGRLNATSVMIAAPAFSGEEAAALSALAQEATHVQIGLHVTLTAPFHPLTLHFSPLKAGAFLPLPQLLLRALTRQLDAEIFEAEIAAQLAAFIAAFGRAPDFVDGHQHVQIFPRIRDAFLRAVRTHAPTAWVRQCARPPRAANGRGGLKARLLDSLSAAFRARAAQAGLSVNPAFDGAYDFTRDRDFAALFQSFLKNQPDGALIMCHPGHVDAELRALDPLTDQREREFAYFQSEAFTAALTAENMSLA